MDHQAHHIPLVLMGKAILAAQARLGDAGIGCPPASPLSTPAARTGFTSREVMVL
jgi:hypothetical protein